MPVGTANGTPANAEPYKASSATGSQMAPQRQSPSVRTCTRWPAPTAMISPARIPIPPQTSAIPLRIGNNIKTMLAGTAMNATRASCSSTADSRKRCSVSCVSLARNWPRPAISRPRQPSSCKAAAKSSGSLNSDVTLPGIFDYPVQTRDSTASLAGSIGDNADSDARRLFSFGRNAANPRCAAQSANQDKRRCSDATRSPFKPRFRSTHHVVL